MERLWTPWRMQYMTDSTVSSGPKTGCVFCDKLEAGDDEAAYILWRGENVFAILNAYPYNTGHLMVMPFAHVGDLGALSAGARTELFETAYRATEHIRTAMNAEGFNLGLNLGSAAGAGIPGHLHLHVVPRWGGDTNFMPVTAKTKILPEMLDDTYVKLRPLFLAEG